MTHTIHNRDNISQFGTYGGKWKVGGFTIGRHDYAVRVRATSTLTLPPIGVCGRV